MEMYSTNHEQILILSGGLVDLDQSLLGDKWMFFRLHSNQVGKCAKHSFAFGTHVKLLGAGYSMCTFTVS